MRTTLVIKLCCHHPLPCLLSSTHQHWQEMMTNCSVSEEFSLANTEQDNDCSITREEARLEVESQPEHNNTAAPQPAWIHTWSFVDVESSAWSLQSPVLLTATISCLALLVV